MATANSSAATPRQAGFRHLATGAIVVTGCFHDITRLPGEGVDLEWWEAGFTDSDGRFYDRQEAARLVGVHGHLESESYFAGEARPTLEAGHVEAWRRQTCSRAREVGPGPDRARNGRPAASRSGTSEVSRP